MSTSARLLLSLALLWLGALSAQAAKYGVPVPDGPWRKVAVAADSTTYHAVARLADGGFIIVWDRYEIASGYTVWARRYDAAAAPVGAAWRVTTATYYPHQIAVTGLTDGGYVIAWPEQRYCSPTEGVSVNVSNLRIRRYSSTNSVTSARLLRQTCGLDHFQKDAALAGLSDGGYAVTWVESLGTPVQTMMVRAFSASNAIEATFPVVSYPDGYLNRLRITDTSQGGYAVAWDYGRAGNPGNEFHRAYVRPYSAAHVPIASAVRLCNWPGSFPYCMVGGLTRFGGTGYAVSWSLGANINAPGTYFRSFTSTGATSSTLVRATPYGGPGSSQSTIVDLPDNGGVVLTTDLSYVNAEPLKIRRLDSSGVPTGPSITLDETGGQGTLAAARIGTDKVVAVVASSNFMTPGELGLRVLRTTGAPYALDDLASGPSSQILLIDALANDQDPDQFDTLVVTEASAVHGSVTVTATQKLRYTPVHGAGCVNNDTISYTIADTGGLTSTARVTVFIGCVQPKTSN